jgi:hypothetical protein
MSLLVRHAMTEAPQTLRVPVPEGGYYVLRLTAFPTGGGPATRREIRFAIED